MSLADPKETLVHYLQGAREAMLWKLDGLSEYDVRRPLTPTGTNLLGLVKHLASVELGYFGETFGRPQRRSTCRGTPTTPTTTTTSSPRPRSRANGWSTSTAARGRTRPRPSRQLDLDAVGHVAHWGNEEVTLHQILVHVATETHHHAGHADIVREMIDGSAGFLAASSNLPDDGYDWSAYVAKVQASADGFR